MIVKFIHGVNPVCNNHKYQSGACVRDTQVYLFHILLKHVISVLQNSRHRVDIFIPKYDEEENRSEEKI